MISARLLSRYVASFQYINGGDLEKFLLRKKTLLSWKQRVQLALDVARGIKYLHSVGIFHRDLSAQVRATYTVSW